MATVKEYEGRPVQAMRWEGKESYRPFMDWCNEVGIAMPVELDGDKLRFAGERYIVRPGDYLVYCGAIFPCKRESFESRYFAEAAA